MKSKVILKYDKFFNALTKLVGGLLLIVIVLLGIDIILSNNAKSDIKEGLNSTIESLKEQTGANSIDIDVFSDETYFVVIPTDLKFDAFLTVNVDSIKSKTEDDWYGILSNGQKLKKDYGFHDDGYAIYSRTIRLSYLKRESKIFITITDGHDSLCLTQDSYYNNPKLVKKNALEQLAPSSIGKSIKLLTFIVVVLAAAFIALLYKKSKKKTMINDAGVKLYKVFAEAKIDPSNEDKAIVAGKKIATEYGIINFNECYADLYKIGRNYQTKVLKAADADFDETDNSAIGNILQGVDSEIGIERIAKNKKKRSMGIIVAILSGVVLAGVVFCVVKFYVIPNNMYQEAVALKDSGDDIAAYDLFNEVGDFKDARDICNEYDYNDAMVFLDEGFYAEAYVYLCKIEGYPEADAKREELLGEYPYLSVLSAQAGDVIQLGVYEQDNGVEPIEWNVIYNNEGLVYAVSKKVLDGQQFNTANGDGSSLKQWLKEDFYKVAFGIYEDGFVNKVGLLTKDDISTYSQVIGNKPEWTKYAMSKKPKKGFDGTYSWWIDDEYFHGSGVVDVQMAVSGGYVSSVTTVNGVRPTIVIDATGLDIDYYLDDYADMENAGKVTRTKYDIERERSKYKNKSDNKKNDNTCSTCSGTGRVTKHFGKRWSKMEGYGYGDVCHDCGGTGKR